MPFDSARIASAQPSGFALVMATGIVAIAGHLAGFHGAAKGLFAFAIVAFVVLAAVHALRVLRHGAAVRADLAEPARVTGFFTWVAACGVLGSESVLIADTTRAGWTLWVMALLLWLAFTWAALVAFARNAGGAPLERTVSGATLLAVVATESIAVLSALLRLDFVALAAWLAGMLQYAVLIAFVAYRLAFRPLAPAELTPPYWITMGAMAISTLAGALIALNAEHSPALRRMLPLVEMGTLACWCVATAWIPVLIALGAWRHGARGVPLRYEPTSWSLVFPLGMYSAATHELAQALGLPALHSVALAFFAIAALAWLVTCVGMARAEWRHAARR